MIIASIIIFMIAFMVITYFLISKVWWAIVLSAFVGIIAYILLLFIFVELIMLFFPYAKKRKGKIVYRKKPYKIYFLINREACKFVRAFYHVRIVNKFKGKLPDETYLLVSNHQNLLDPLFLIEYIKNGEICFLMKDQLKKIPLVGRWLYNSGFLYVDREHNREGLKTIIKAIDVLKSGQNVGVFIEGTRSRGPNLGEFRDGTLKMATKTGKPIVVTCVDNTYKITKPIVNRHKILIKVCKVLYYEDYKDMNTQELGELIKNIMIENLEYERSTNLY